MPFAPFSQLLHKVPTGIRFALLATLSFGGLTTLASLYYREGGNAFTMLLIRFVITSLVLGVILYWRTRPPRFGRLRGGVLVVGVAWSLGVTCYLGSVHYVDVGIAALILYTFPIIVLILSFITRDLRSTPQLWALFLAAFAGLALMLLPSLGNFHPLGLLLAFAASLMFAVTFFIGARIGPEVPALTMAFQTALVGLVLMLLLVYWSDAFRLPQGKGWLWLIIATLLYLCGILAQFSALARVRAAQVAMAMNLEPIVSLTLAAWVLGERMTSLQWLGALAVLGALLLSQRVMQQSAP